MRASRVRTPCPLSPIAARNSSDSLHAKLAEVGPDTSDLTGRAENGKRRAAGLWEIQLSEGSSGPLPGRITTVDEQSATNYFLTFVHSPYFLYTPKLVGENDRKLTWNRRCW